MIRESCHQRSKNADFGLIRIGFSMFIVGNVPPKPSKQPIEIYFKVLQRVQHNLIKMMYRYLNMISISHILNIRHCIGFELLFGLKSINIFSYIKIHIVRIVLRGPPTWISRQNHVKKHMLICREYKGSESENQRMGPFVMGLWKKKWCPSHVLFYCFLTEMSPFW